MVRRARPLPLIRHRLLRRAAIAAAVLIAAGVVGWLALDRPLPDGEPGAAADALARRMTAAVDCEAWRDVPAVAWTFAGDARHLWDRRRGLARVTSGDVTALLDLASGDGVAFEHGERLEGDDAARAVRRARERFFNDSFWLNPVCKAFDVGVERRLVRRDDGDALLVTYTSGGVTPGDSYLWLLDDDGRPVAWRMWVSILPLGGLRASWEGWIELPGGARVATEHGLAGLVTLRIGDVETPAVSRGEDDPFRALVAPPAG